MSNLINCKNCGILFKKTFRNICNDCWQVENDVIEKIIKYVEHVEVEKRNDISLESISEALDIPFSEVDGLYRNGRLTTIAGRIKVKCKICKTLLNHDNRVGYFCSKCANTIVDPDNKILNNDIKIDKNIPLKKFHKNVMHTSRNEDDKKKYGFKKDYE